MTGIKIGTKEDEKMGADRVSEILSWYPAMTNQQKYNLLRFINYGRIGGTGKFVLLPVDQGFEHGPGRSFQPNPAGYDPLYHAKLAIDSGCNGSVSYTHLTLPTKRIV